MFADLNKNAIKPSKSLSILYDHRNSFSQFIVKMVGSIDVFRGKVDFEKTTIGNRSVKVFTLNGILDATKKLLDMSRARKITEEEVTTATDFWETVSRNIPEWQMLVKGRIKSKEIRDEYVHSSTNCLNSLGIAGRVMRQTYPGDWLKRLRICAALTGQGAIHCGMGGCCRRLDGADHVRNRDGCQCNFAGMRRAAFREQNGV